MTNLLIQNGHVVDPANGIDGKADVLVENGKIAVTCEFCSATYNFAPVDVGANG